MKKTSSLFQRNYDGDRLVRDELVPGAEWVAAGEGTATRKHDGTCCMVRDGKFYKRYDCKRGQVPHDGFEPAQDADSETGHWPGWMPVGDGPEDARHREAWGNGCGHSQQYSRLANGTYELCGPKVQKNPEGYSSHVLVRHGYEVLDDAPRTFDALREYLRCRDVEGIVWHHEDGRMVKIKGRDFGLRRG